MEGAPAPPAPSRFPSAVRRHYDTSHHRRRVVLDECIALPCKLGCDPGKLGHYHCPYCPEILPHESAFVSHARERHSKAAMVRHHHSVI